MEHTDRFDLIQTHTAVLATTPNPDAMLVAQTSCALHGYLKSALEDGIGHPTISHAHKLLVALSCVIYARVNFCAQQVGGGSNTSLNKTVVGPWSDVLGMSFVTECQLRLLLADLSVALLQKDVDRSDGLGEPPSDAPHAAVYGTEKARWMACRTGIEPTPMSVLKERMDEHMRGWNADRPGAQLGDALNTASLVTLAKPLSGSHHDVPEWVMSCSNDESATQPAPAFIRYVERISTLDGARTELRHVTGLRPHHPPAFEEVSGELRQHLRDWWQRFDVAHMTAALGVEIGESCTLEAGTITPLDPYLMRDGRGGCPEENLESPASWILSTLYPDQVRAVRSRCEDVLANDVTLFEIFAYSARQTCDFDFKTACLASDRQPLHALHKLWQLQKSKAVKPLPVIIQLDHFFVMYTRSRPCRVFGSRLDCLLAWCQTVLETYDGVVGRKLTIKELLKTMLAPKPAVVTSDTNLPGKWKDVTPGTVIDV